MVWLFFMSSKFIEMEEQRLLKKNYNTVCTI